MAARTKSCLATIVSAAFTGVLAPVLVNFMTYRLEHDVPPAAPAAPRVDWSRPQPMTPPAPAAPGANDGQPPARGWEVSPHTPHAEWDGASRRQ